jgi:hypothetical protein
MINSVLFGNGYWANIVKEKIVGLTNLVAVVDSKTDISILNKSDIDIAFVCSSTSSHYDIVKRCLDKDIKYIFCTKPFTGEYKKAKELYGIAKQKNIRIFVDNLFLYRNEIINAKFKNVHNFFFYWEKPFLNDQENICNNLLYHDLYLLLKWSKSKKWKVSFFNMNKTNLFLSMTNGKQSCDFEYIILDNKEKWIVLNGDSIDLSTTKEDPLNDCILKILQDKMDFEANKKVTLETLKLLDYIKNKVYDKQYVC